MEGGPRDKRGEKTQMGGYAGTFDDPDFGPMPVAERSASHEPIELVGRDFLGKLNERNPHIPLTIETPTEQDFGLIAQLITTTDPKPTRMAGTMKETALSKDVLTDRLREIASDTSGSYVRVMRYKKKDNNTTGILGCCVARFSSRRDEEGPKQGKEKPVIEGPVTFVRIPDDLEVREIFDSKHEPRLSLGDTISNALLRDYVEWRNLKRKDPNLAQYSYSVELDLTSPPS